MRAGIDIAEVETATKIRARYLRAIENEEWGMLPGPTFVRSFLRTYAEYLGLDAKMLVDEYKLRHEPVPDQDPHSLPPLGREPRVRLRAPALPRGWAIGLSIAAVFVLLIILGSIGKEPGGTTATVTRAPRTQTHRAPARPPPPTTVKLALIPTGEVYVCLRDTQGELIVNETLVPQGGERVFTGERFRLTVGRATIKVRVNGKSLKIPDTGAPVTYELKPGTRKLLPDVSAC